MYVYEHKSAKYVDQKTPNQNPCVTLTSVCTPAICKNSKLQDLKKYEVVHMMCKVTAPQQDIKKGKKSVKTKELWQKKKWEKTHEN